MKHRALYGRMPRRRKAGSRRWERRRRKKRGRWYKENDKIFE